MNNRHNALKTGMQTIGLLLLFVLPQMAAGLLALLLFNLSRLCSGKGLDINLLNTTPTAMGTSMILSAVLTIAGMVLIKEIRIKDFTANGNSGKVYGYTALLMLSAIFLINLGSEFLSLEDKNKELFEQLMHNPAGIIAIVLTGPFAEELVFRMGIQRNFIRLGLAPSAAILLSAMVFGGIHLNPVQIPAGFAFGLILGWLYHRSGSIWVPIFAHVLNNLAGVVSAWATGDTEMTFSELCGGTWPTAAITFVAAGLFVFCIGRLQDAFSCKCNFDT